MGVVEYTGRREGEGNRMDPRIRSNDSNLDLIEKVHLPPPTFVVGFIFTTQVHVLYYHKMTHYVMLGVACVLSAWGGGIRFF